jgi:hypothetical protein
MTQKRDELTPRQQQVVAEIETIGGLEKTFSIQTNRRVNDILDKLGPEDLAAVRSVVFPRGRFQRVFEF